jgi:hypothetical protein
VMEPTATSTRSAGDYNAQTNVLQAGRTQAVLVVDYQFYAAPDSMHVYYDNALIYDSGLVSFTNQVEIPFGPGTATNVVIIVNEGNNDDTNTLWTYTATIASPEDGYVTFTENTNLAQVPIKFAPVPLVAAGTNREAYYLPEQRLSALIGQRAFGPWQLELRDSGKGAGVPPAQLVTWELEFVFQNEVSAPIDLSPAGPATNTIPPGQIGCFYVEAPAWATRATNTLVSATAPVNLLFNQTTPPTGTNAGDLVLLTGATGASVTLRSGGWPSLLPGQRYYLGIQNPGVSNVTAALQVAFDISVTPLSNGMSCFATNWGVGDAIDYYRFTVSSNAVRAQFEIRNPSSDMTLVVSQGPPPPTLTNYAYMSANPGPNDELVAVFSYSQPVPLAPGDWFISAVNVSGIPVNYSIRATEFPVFGTNVVITEYGLSGGVFCLTWTSLPGVAYYVQGITDSEQTNWVAVSSTITASDMLTTYCVPLSSNCRYFRVREGLAVVPWLPPVQIAGISWEADGVLLQWIAPTDSSFRVEWATTISSPSWNAFTNMLTATNGGCSFLDDGTQSNGLNVPRYYRLRQTR